MITLERVNNALWCCDEIEELIKHYKKQYLEEKAIGHIQDRTKALVYYDVIKDLEIILYGESEIDTIGKDKDVERDKIKNIIERKTQYYGESLVEYCKRAYENDRRTCDNFHTLLVKRPYTYKGMKKGYSKNCFPDITITELLKNTDKWKNYIIKSVQYNSDCSISVSAELPCKTVNDLIYYCGCNIDSNCIFKEVLSNTEYTLDYVKMHDEEFENTVYVKEVDVNENKTIKYIYFMKNKGD